jgi:predicted dithiol-disulfide oxidoreductase (DUF899 family)
MTHQIVSEDTWISARKQLLPKEKELTRMQDEVNQLRRDLPWHRVEKSYVFDASNGKQSLAQLFDGRSQLVVYHFMFGPGWAAGCVGCSFFADHVDGANIHLAHHDVTFVAISRAPLAEIEAYKKRMGWRFTWVSSHGTDFNSDYHVSFTKGDLAKGPTYYNFEVRESQTEGEAPRDERVLQGSERHRLSYLFRLCAGRRPRAGHLHVSRPDGGEQREWPQLQPY